MKKCANSFNILHVTEYQLFVKNTLIGNAGNFEVSAPRCVEGDHSNLPYPLISKVLVRDLIPFLSLVWAAT